MINVGSILAARVHAAQSNFVRRNCRHIVSYPFQNQTATQLQDKDHFLDDFDRTCFKDPIHIVSMVHEQLRDKLYQAIFPIRFEFCDVRILLEQCDQSHLELDAYEPKTKAQQ